MPAIKHKQLHKHYDKRPCKRTTGFTLVEVLVALTIIAIALGALLNSAGTQASSTSYLKQKTLAHWVAVNELTQMRIAGEFPDLGDKRGSTEMANHAWYWIRTTKQTEDENAREVSIQVFEDEDYKKNLTTLVGYATKDKQ
jgi:general secretion pathway protein I